MELWIDVCIPFEPGRKLAYAYNRKVESSSAEWFLFLDHDVFLVNPLWYLMSLAAIKKLEGEKVGWITAKTNRIGCKAQKHVPLEDSDDLNHHIDIASQLYKKQGSKISLVSGNPSGFFILTNRTAWKAVGGFDDRGKGISGIDIYYASKLRSKGFKIYVMEGLYLYHLYKKRKKELYSKF